MDFEPFSAEIRVDPYPAYARLREEAPVHYAPDAGLYCVSRYDDVRAVLTDPARFSSRAMRTVLQPGRDGSMRATHLAQLMRFLFRLRMNPLKLARADNLICVDPPRHDELRAVVNRGFSPRQTAAWEPRLREIVEEEVGEKIARGDAIEVVEDIAVPLPTRVIAELLGIPAETRSDFKRWSDGIIRAVSGPERIDPIGNGLLEHLGELNVFLREFIRARRRRPEDDLISHLIDPGQQDVLDDAHVLQFVLVLLVAGNETTTNLIGNATQALLDAPEQLERVASEPERIPDLVEEALRFDPPIQMLFRTATCDVEIGGVRIPKGANVAPILASANRDPRRFDDPEHFDVTRDARGHLAFGFGLHFCLGASLARLEGRAALEALVPELVRRQPRVRRAPIIDSFLIRGRRELWLEPPGAGQGTRAA